MKYAEVLFTQKVIDDIKPTLTYSIPDHIEAQVGHSVLVPLRRSKKSGIIIDIHHRKPDFRTLPITEITSNTPLLNESQIKLLKWVSKYYFAPLFSCLKLFIPARILENKPIKSRKKEDEQIIRSPQKELTEDQKGCIKNILNSKHNTHLIHGITGSGKTEIYTRLANHFTEKGEQVLILVPEISLTPQTIDYFQKTTGHKAAIIHSKRSAGERYNDWKRIHNGTALLTIGSRSSIFTPFKNLGLIIIDEEHELSYKQDSSPRYNTHTVAEKLQEFSPNIKIVLGSATPSVETTEKYKDSTTELNNRVGTSTLPEIEIVDLRDEFKKKNHSIFSEKLHQEIEKALAKKEQVILFLNRRGSSSSVVCRDCGYMEKCETCDTNLTYHAKTLSTPSLICHHCGKIETPPSTCKGCKGVNIRFLGIGTQRIELETKKAFPNARILRADKDTTATKEGFKKIYNAFKKNEADILIGTQMIAKGLHLPNVNLVGVILADIGLSIPDFRTQERNFQLLTQVAGRAGRTNNRGKVIIQTYNPESASLIHTKNNNHQALFQYERAQRSLLKYPPFSKLTKFIIEKPTYKEAQTTAEKIEAKLWQFARELQLTENLEINIYPAYLTKFKNKFRYIVLIKSPNETQIHKVLEKLPKEVIMNPEIKIDIDPISTT
ncbi:primosomal protein N' [Candidatus Peregrinibacteria bacterium CG10_big_fil_rev_8_21_14_0_10_36_19]|nr:MAG: primosomal protein N' [Candidatus Peregrinibacteria bacterium CG10_big_fil_rev_8_21_14_0_10_36_19]